MLKRISKGEAIFNVVNYIILAICVLVTLLPFAMILAKSLSSSVAIESGKLDIKRKRNIAHKRPERKTCSA
ncbi:MAG: hypothetical protein UH081_02075 [Clostridia bacterium]|nr:hypothetical protein [Clostridia bacterium]